MAELERDKVETLDRLVDGLEPAHPAPEDLRALVGLAVELRRTLAPAAATAATRERILSRVLHHLRTQTSQAHRQGASPPRRPLILRPAFAIAGLAVALLLTFGTGAAYAAESTLPGDTLYPVKLGLEQARLALSPSTAGDAALMASFTDRRLEEIEALTARGRWSDAERALDAYPTFVDDLVRMEALVADPDKAADIEARLAHHLAVLEEVRGKAPESAQPALLNALDRAGGGREEVEGRQDDKKKPERTPPGQEKKSTDSPGNSGG